MNFWITPRKGVGGGVWDSPPILSRSRKGCGESEGPEIWAQVLTPPLGALVMAPPLLVARCRPTLFASQQRVPCDKFVVSPFPAGAFLPRGNLCVHKEGPCLCALQLSPQTLGQCLPQAEPVSKKDLVISGEVWGFKTCRGAIFSGGGGGTEHPFKHPARHRSTPSW